MATLKSFAWTTLCFLWMISTVNAATMYVSEIREISIRSGPASEHKIASFVTTGQPLTVLETSGDWTRVQTAQGKEGWILTRFLKSEAPTKMAVYELENKVQQVNLEKTNLATEYEQLKAKAKAMEAELASAKDAVSRVEGNYEKLKKDATASEVLTLKSQAKEALETLAKEKERSDRFEKEYNQLSNEQRIKWFLIGAGVFFFGLIAGYTMKSSRRKSSW